MTGRPRYKEMHEVRYRELKHSAHRGWGAEQVPEREESWRTYWRTWTCAPIAPEDFPKSGKVLELGAGAGNISPIIENSGYDVTGIEISPTAVEMASKRNPGIPYFEGSITDLSRFPEASFDIVFDGLCLHCIIGEDRRLAFQEIARVLRPGGFFLLNSICGDPKDPEILKSFDPISRCHIIDGTPYRYLGTPAALLGELTSHGFEVLHHEKMSNPQGESLRVLARRAVRKR